MWVSERGHPYYSGPRSTLDPCFLLLFSPTGQRPSFTEGSRVLFRKEGWKDLGYRSVSECLFLCPPIFFGSNQDSRGFIIGCDLDLRVDWRSICERPRL